jgi:integrase
VSGQSLDRHTFHPTRTRGFTYRLASDGSKRFYGFVSGRGRVALKASGERAARAEWDDLRGKRAKGEQTPTTKKRLAEVGEEYLRDVEKRLRRPKQHRQDFERETVPVLGHRPITEITPQEIINLDKSIRDRGLAEATAANYLKPLRGTFEYAALEYGVANPFLRIPRGRLSSCNTTRKHREWTTAEVLRLIEEGYLLDARETKRAEYGLCIEFKLRTGGRLAEVFGARYRDINFVEGVWIIAGQWTRDGEYVAYAKTEKSLGRRVPLAPQLVKKIAARKLQRGAGDDDFIFAGARGRPISHTNFRKRGWNLAVANAGLTDGPKVTPHDARHAFASEAAENGLSSSDVADVLGHTTAGITERIYVHAFNKEAREARIREAMARAMGAS